LLWVVHERVETKCTQENLLLATDLPAYAN